MKFIPYDENKTSKFYKEAEFEFNLNIGKKYRFVRGLWWDEESDDDVRKNVTN